MAEVPSIPGTEPEGGGSRTLGGWWFSTTILLVLGGLFPLLFTQVELGSLKEPPAFFSLVVTEWASFRLLRLLSKGRPHLVQTTFWVFVYIWFGLAALAQTTAQRFPIANQQFTESVQTNALLTVIVGLAAYELGILWRRSSPSSRVGGWLEQRQLSPPRIVALAGLGLAATAYALWTYGLAIFFSSRYSIAESIYGRPDPGLRLDQLGNKAIGLLEATLVWAPAFLALYLLLVLHREGSRNKTGQRLDQLLSPMAIRLLLISLTVANVLVNNPISSPRYRVGGAALALFAIMWSIRKPVRYQLWSAGLIFAVLFALPIADVFRYDDRTIEFAPLREQLLTSPDFGMFQQELNAQVYVANNGFTLGEQAVGVVFGYVPRALWPGKPIDTGNVIVRSDAINASASLWATVYVDGGILAVAATFLFYGRLTELWEGLYLRRGRDSSFLYAGVPLYAGFQLILLRGDLQPAVGQLAPLLVILLFASQSRVPSATADDLAIATKRPPGQTAQQSV